MSKLNDLITKLCPDGVQYKKLGDLCTIETGRLNANKAVDDGAYPFFTTAEKTSRINSYRWDTEALLIAGNANVGSVKHYTGKFEAYQRTYVLTNFNQDINVRFLFHFTRAFLKKYLANKSNSAAMTYIVLSTLKNFEIPLPPLPVQEEVVRILDSFTTLEAELEAELSDRKEQYEYYRDYLLDKNTLERMDGKPVAMMKLEEVAEIKRGHRVVKKELSKDSNSGYPVYQNSLKPLGYHTYSNEKAGTPFVIAAGSAGEIGYSDVDYWGADDCYSIECDNNTVNGRYIYHALLFKQYLIKSQVRRASIPRLSSTVIKHLEIPVPSIATQERVVDILDRFDALTTSLTDGIPAEIAMRREQYEYYRSRLLDFQHLPDGSASVSDGE